MKVHCNNVNNSYEEKSRVLHTSVPNKLFGQLLDISPKNLIFLKTFNSGFSYTEVWFGYFNLSGKYSQKLLDHAKVSTTNAIKTASNKAIQKKRINQWVI